MCHLRVLSGAFFFIAFSVIESYLESLVIRASFSVLINTVPSGVLTDRTLFKVFSYMILSIFLKDRVLLRVIFERVVSRGSSVIGFSQ